MTAGLLELAELAVQSGVPAPRLRQFAEALAAAETAYHFPHDVTSGDAALSCDLVADGGDVHDRIGVWQRVIGRVERREPLPDTPAGVALRFPFDVDLAGTLGRLAAAEYRCCSFGSYTLIVDGTGLCLEVRMPADAAGTLAAVVGLPDTLCDRRRSITVTG